MKVLICPDSYKGTAEASEAACAIRDGIMDAVPETECTLLPIADGGEGSVSAVANAVGAEWMYADVCGPYGESVRAKYALCGSRAYIEMAEVSGICLSQRRDPELASTYGTGELMADALHHGATELVIFIGGSATCDGGMGMAAALGYRFLDADGKELYPCGKSMGSVRDIISPSIDPLGGAVVYCACDVTNPMYGEQGAAFVFAPQKGADRECVLRLDSGLKQFANAIENSLGIDVHTIPGGGAARGLGAGLYAFAGARMRGGFELISDALSLEKRISETDIVITGEGCTDRQSMMGKVVGHIADLSKKYNKRCIALSGIIKDSEEILRMGMYRLYSSSEYAPSIEQSMQFACKYIRMAAYDAAADILG